MDSHVRKLPREILLKRLGLLAAMIAFFIPWIVDFPGLSPEGHKVFSIFLLAIVLWVAEAIPLHATAALIIILEILLISDRALFPLSEGFIAPSYSTFYHALAHPVLMLFLGGFFLADGAAKFKVDQSLARVLLRPFGTSPPMVMLGLMVVTATFSMFMSNTATTATMMAVVLPVMASLKPESRLRAGLALSIPVAANIGGIGTPVGTPPNAIALGTIAEAGFTISFVQWMAMAIPFMIVILIFSWILLIRLFPGSEEPIRVEIESTFEPSRPAIIFCVTAVVTILLWLTEPIHHVKSTVVGFFPVVVLLSTGVFSKKDLQSVQWHVLWLVAGGIALGAGVSGSGLDQWLIDLVRWDVMSTAVIGAALFLVALFMGSVISHSATANLLVPIGMSLAMSDAVKVSPIIAGVYIALGASLAMALPISTPPNAIAYSTGQIKTKDMAITGIIIGLFGWLLVIFVAPWLWNMLGVFPK